MSEPKKKGGSGEVTGLVGEPIAMNEYIDSLFYVWRASRKFGLTIPFLVGALRLKGLVGGPVSGSLRSLLKELQAGSTKYRLAHCSTANDFILAPVSGRPDGCKRVSANGAATSLWVPYDLVNNDESDNLFKALWERYSSDLEDERYSCTSWEYHEYTSKDIALIEKAYKELS